MPGDMSLGNSFNKETLVTDVQNRVKTIHNMDGDENKLSQNESVILSDYINNLENWYQSEKNSLTKEVQANIEDMITEQKTKLEALKTDARYTEHMKKQEEADDITQRFGADFYQKVFSPMQSITEKAFDYFVTTGSLEGFSAQGIPLDVTITNLEIVEDFSDPSNDRYDFFNGQGQTTRVADSQKVCLTFTVGDIEFKISSGSQPPNQTGPSETTSTGERQEDGLGHNLGENYDPNDPNNTKRFIEPEND